MGRKDALMANYIEDRKAALSAMSTEDLAITIGEYFDGHRTMPGQKDLKDAAEKILANIAENPDFDVDADTKTGMINSFTQMVVRDMKVEKLLVKNVTKANRDDAAVLKASDLGLVETGSEPAVDKQPAKKFYEAAARIENGKVIVDKYEIGSLGEGFVQNNPGVVCPATVLAVDYSNGKFANVSYTVIADIAVSAKAA